MGSKQARQLQLLACLLLLTQDLPLHMILMLMNLNQMKNILKVLALLQLQQLKIFRFSYLICSTQSPNVSGDLH